MASSSDIILRVIAEKGASVDQVLAATEASFKKLGMSLKEGLRSFDEFGERARAAGDRAGVGFAAAAASAGLMVRSWLSHASEMEQFTARLATVQHSSAAARDTMSDIVQYAASTPFEIKGLTAASVQLEALGQNSRALLPLVTQMAAGMGKPVEETAAAIGKAFAGSAEGVEILRNQFGLSVQQLKKYGAEINSAGEISMRTSDQVERMQKAIKTWANITFSGAVERQMNTLMGASSNLSDAIGRLATGLGDRLIPTFSSLAKVATGVVEKFERLPAPVKDFIAFGTLAAGVGAAFGAGLLLLGGRVMDLVKGMNDLAKSYLAYQAMTTAADAAAAGATSSFLKATVGGSALVQVLRQAAGAAAAFAATPIGIALIGAAAIYTAATAAISSMDEANKRWSQQIESDADRVKTLGGATKDYIKILKDLEAQRNKSNPGSSPTKGPDVPNDVVGWMKNLLATASPAELSGAMDRAGITSKTELDKMLDKPKRAAQSYRDEEALLSRGQAALTKLVRDQAAGGGVAPTAFSFGKSPNSGGMAGMHPSAQAAVSLGPGLGLSESDAQALSNLFGGKLTVSVTEWTQKIREARAQLARLAEPTEMVASAFGNIIDRWQAVADLARQQQKNTKEFFAFVDKEGTSSGQVEKAKMLEQQSIALQEKIKSVGLKTDSASIRSYLKGNDLSPEKKELVGRLLDIRGDAKKAYEEARKLDAEETQKKVEKLKQDLANKKAAGQAGVEEERRVNAQIAQIRKDHSWNKLVGKQEVTDRKASLEEQLTTSRNYLEKLKSQNLLTAGQEAAGYQRILAQVRDWKKTILPQLIKADPSQAAALKSWFEGVEKDASTKSGESSRAARLQQLNDTKRLNDKFLEDQRARYELSTERELEIVQQGRKRMEALGGQVNASGDPTKLAEYQTTMREYINQEAALRKKLHEEEISRAQERNNTRLTFLASEMEALSEQQAKGKAVNDQVLANLRQQLALKLQNIQLTAQKELEVQGLTEQQIQAIRQKADVSRLEALRAQRALLKQMLEDQTGALKDLQEKIGKIKSAAESSKQQEQPFGSSVSIGGEGSFGYDWRQRQAASDPGVIDRLVRRNSLDRSDWTSLSEALRRQGLILTNDKSQLGKRNESTGETYTTLEQFRQEYGVKNTKDADKIAEELAKLDKQIEELQNSLQTGLNTEIGNLNTGVGNLKSAIDNLTAAVRKQEQVIATGHERTATTSKIPEVQAAWKAFRDSMADIGRREDADKASRGKNLEKSELERYDKERQRAESTYNAVLDRYGVTDPSRPLVDAAQQHSQAAGKLSAAGDRLDRAASAISAAGKGDEKKPGGGGGVGGEQPPPTPTPAPVSLETSMRAKAQPSLRTWFNNPDNFIQREMPTGFPAPDLASRPEIQLGSTVHNQQNSVNATINIGVNGGPGGPAGAEAGYWIGGLSEYLQRQYLSPNANGDLPTYGS